MARASTASLSDTQQRRLDGKTALVTGAGRGIGKAIATALVHAGAHTIFVVRDRQLGEKLAAEQEAQGRKAGFGVADVTDPSQLSMLVLDLEQCQTKIDILVNNAGVFLQEDRDTPPSAIDTLVLLRTLETNLFGPIRLSTAIIPHMPDGGRIINVSSTMGQFAGEPQTRGPAYCMSKSALNMYTQMLAADLRDRRIMVDAFHPGWVKTDMGGPRATVEPEEAARTALFLATRPASEQTGLFWRGTQPIEW